jgi:hypothetical protein
VADKSLTDLIRIYFKAYETKDRSALESTLSDDFTFTSPHDGHIDRATYLERCWPNSKHTRGDPHSQAFRSRQRSLCPLRFGAGQPFRNTEFFTGSGGKIKTIEVYFGSKIGGIEDIK